MPTSRLDETSFPAALTILPHPSGSYTGSQDDDTQHFGWKDWWAFSDLRSCLGQELWFLLRFYIRVLQKNQTSRTYIYKEIYDKELTSLEACSQHAGGPEETMTV